MGNPSLPGGGLTMRTQSSVQSSLKAVRDNP